MSRPRSARNLVVWLSVYLLLAANWALWFELIRIGGGLAGALKPLAAMLLLTGLGTMALLTLTAWTRGMKPLWLVIVLIAAVAQHYMLTYRAVMDPTMLANVMQSDLHETRDLLSGRMALNVLLVMVLPALWLSRARLAPMRCWGQVWRNLVLFVVLIALLGGCIVGLSRELAPLMRNNVTLRYLMNPLAPIYSVGVALLRPIFRHQRKLIPITAGTALGPSYAAQAKPPLLVIVVGETARADHFSLNGYLRPNNPALAAHQVLSWTNVHSCGTNTLASVPCMFSMLGKQRYESRKNDYENLLDVLQAAGLAVLWIDNQAGGCKGVCDRVPHVMAVDGLDAATKAVLCNADECLDNALLDKIDARIAALPPERRARGVVLAMHQMGSHGPAYYKRSPPELKPFRPECVTKVLADCSHSELINGFDNSIAYTDQFLGKTIDWLKTQSALYDTGLLYISDHGESLGEYGLYLHGLPYRVAPEEQKHIPMVAWFDGGLAERRKLSIPCLRASRDAPLTHDNLYPTVLGMLDVTTPTYQPELDALAPCRAGG